MTNDDAYRYQGLALGYLQERTVESQAAFESMGEVDLKDVEDVRIAIAVEESTEEARVALRVYKRDAAHERVIREMKDRGLVPEDVEIEEIGPLFGFGPRDLVMPLRPGIRCAHVFGDGGTVGCLLKKDGRHLLLSANHVLALENHATRGDNIFQPISSVVPHRKVATLTDFETLNLLGNKMDAAVAEIVVGDFDPVLFNGKTIRDVRTDPLTTGDRLFKFGQTTEERSGTYLSRTSHIKLQMSFGDYFFDEQIEVRAAGTPFSCNGDSGALVYDQDDKAVGIVIGGNCTDLTIVTPIGPILERFTAELA